MPSLWEDTKIPVNLDEALRQIGRYLYGVQHHERAQRVTHSLEALDEGSGTEVRAEKDAVEWLRGTFH